MDQKKSAECREFEELTFCYVEQLFRLAYLRIGNPQDAEDIVQDTYLKAFRAFGTFNRQASIKNWLTRILINTVLDYQRKSSRMVPTTSQSEDWEECANVPHQPGPEEKLCQESIDPLLMKSLRSMPDILLIPLLLREIHDASYDEIATILDIPKGTVMSRLYRARTLLRKTLLSNSKLHEPAVRGTGNSQNNSRGSTHELQ